MIPLDPGGSIRLVVESLSGVPLPGARVRAEPEVQDKPDVVPPGASPAVTDEDGVIVLPDLLDRPYRLHISKPGHAKVVLSGVRPGAAVHFATLVKR